MFKVAVGHSNDPDSQFAVEEVLEQIQQALLKLPKEASPKAGMLLSAIDFDHALVLDRIVSAFPDIALIGGTTDGEISSVMGFEQDSLTLTLFCSDDVTMTAAMGRGLSKDVSAACRDAVQKASVGHTEAIKFCVSTPESLTVNSNLVINELVDALGGQVPIFGGLTADQLNTQQTYQFFGREVCSDAIPILLFSGPILFSHGVASGWEPVGKAGRITKSEENTVYEIDHQPALAFYERYLGNLPPSQEYPLAVADSQSDRVYMRAPSGTHDAGTGSVTFFGEIPLGAKVQITEATQDQILSASCQSAQQALETYPGDNPTIALFFSCCSRRQLLGSRTKEEYEQTRHCLESSIQSCGFYTYGEISPLQKQGMTYLHNETFVTLLLGDN